MDLIYEYLINFANYLKPFIIILLVVVLLYVVIILKKIAKTIDKVDRLIDDTNYKLNLLNSPIETVVRYTGALDFMYFFGERNLKKARLYLEANFKLFEEWFHNLKDKEVKEDE